MAKSSLVPVDICNLALSHVGQSPIRNLEENNKPARSCAVVYEQMKRAVLRVAKWKFATRPAVLVAVVDPALVKMGFTGYQLPDDFLRKKRLWFGEYSADVNKDVKHTIMGRRAVVRGLVTEGLNLLYISDRAPEEDFDNLFIDLLALKIAYSLTYSLVQSTSLRNQLLQEYTRQESLAISVDSQDTDEFTNDASYMFNDFAKARLGGVEGPAGNVVPNTSPFIHN